jgi:hypothetical protein
VEVKWKRRSSPSPKEFVKIILGESLSPTSYANELKGSDTWATYGGNEDMWGTAWTAADINSAQFGTAYKGYCNDSTNTLTKNNYATYVRVAVHYSNYLFHCN